MRNLFQTSVPTPAMKVMVDPSVEQPPTKVVYLIQTTNAYVQNMFHHLLLITFTKVRSILYSATLNIGNHSML